ncbi:MAG: serine/threonine protein kinase [Alphaproteobacteria bacterium]|nr:serine/threonine protein kinase [Alphaproteobacteria bacterium]
MTASLPPTHDSLEDESTSTDGPVPSAPGVLVAERYRVLRSIAKGGMGEVLLAEHVDLQRRVALKVMRPPRHGAEGVDFEERFRTEARTLAQLHHPHLVTVHDFGVLPTGRFYLAMEFVEGVRLADLLAQGPLPVERAVRLAVQVAQALGYAHKHGVVHRDLTPSNLLVATDVDGRDHIKLVDFGIVKVDRGDAEETQEGVVLGSPHCMAPEQIDGVGVDARTDLYALGVLLFRMLTGVYPFRGSNTMAILMAHLDAPVPAFAEVAPDRELPEALEDLTRRCLSKAQADRPSDAEAVLAELLPYAGADPLGSTLAVTLPPDLRRAARDAREQVDRRLARPLLVVAAVALVGAVALAVGGLSLLSRPTAAPAATPEPAVQAAVVPVPASDGEAEVEATPVVEPEAPAAEAKPAPKPTPAPRAAARPAPEPAKDPEPEPASRAPARSSSSPRGYKGLPDDF